MTRRRCVVVCLMLALTVPVSGWTNQARGDEKLGAGRVAMHGVERVLVNPGTGTSQAVGYFTFLEGIRGPFFAGTPSETTAFFTFRAEEIPLSPPIANGPNLSVTIIPPGTFRMFLNTSPNQNFNDPASFSAGQLIATFERSSGIIISAGPVITAAFSANLESSVDFVFHGQKFNFKELVPEGITVQVPGSNIPVAGTRDFPLAFPFGFTVTAIGESHHHDE